MVYFKSTKEKNCILQQKTNYINKKDNHDLSNFTLCANILIEMKKVFITTKAYIFFYIFFFEVKGTFLVILTILIKNKITLKNP
jgi:hypothetical protein